MYRKLLNLGELKLYCAKQDDLYSTIIDKSLLSNITYHSFLPGKNTIMSCSIETPQPLQKLRVLLVEVHYPNDQVISLHYSLRLHRISPDSNGEAIYYLFPNTTLRLVYINFAKSQFLNRPATFQFLLIRPIFLVLSR